LVAHRRLTGRAAPRLRGDAYLGPEIVGAEVRQALEMRAAGLRAAGCRVDWPAPGEMAQAAARALADGELVGWVQGRMAWGPRALGARSLLADPRRADVRDVLNCRIKRR
jgi:carbamoyltransferase